MCLHWSSKFVGVASVSFRISFRFWLIGRVCPCTPSSHDQPWSAMISFEDLSDISLCCHLTLSRRLIADLPSGICWMGLWAGPFSWEGAVGCWSKAPEGLGTTIEHSTLVLLKQVLLSLVLSGDISLLGQMVGRHILLCSSNLCKRHPVANGSGFQLKYWLRQVVNRSHWHGPRTSIIELNISLFSIHSADEWRTWDSWSATMWLVLGRCSADNVIPHWRHHCQSWQAVWARRCDRVPPISLM